ncbi:hypothetical protein EIP86_001371 [Pleurotus ostreatoroseus]|nr:hypothetical protein EIP86_001371 [Pleurotus ostreatoroseus]
MAIALAFWSLELKPDEDGAQEISPEADIHITNVALGSELADEKGRTSLKLIYLNRQSQDSEDEEESEDGEDGEDEDDRPKGELVETTICTLTPGMVEQVNTNIMLPKGQPVVFASVGKNVIHLAGNYAGTRIRMTSDEDTKTNVVLDQHMLDQPPSEDELMDSDMDGMSGDEDDELEDAEDEAKDEEEEQKSEPVAAKPASKKRAREPETTEAEVVDESKLSKKERKKLNKKLKAQDGEAVPAPDAAPAKKEVADKSKEEKGKGKAKGKGVEVELAGGVKVLDHKIGSGPEAKKGDTVAMRYVGKLTNGKVFDSNTKGKPFEFTLGDGDVIKGWDVGILGMRAGTERLLTIPPAMGYGKRAQQGIPANSTLIFGTYPSLTQF